jgi:hypothetical protein
LTKIRLILLAAFFVMVGTVGAQASLAHADEGLDIHVMNQGVWQGDPLRVCFKSYRASPASFVVNSDPLYRNASGEMAYLYSTTFMFDGVSERRFTPQTEGWDCFPATGYTERTGMTCLSASNRLGYGDTQCFWVQPKINRFEFPTTGEALSETLRFASKVAQEEPADFIGCVVGAIGAFAQRIKILPRGLTIDGGKDCVKLGLAGIKVLGGG